jgi:hypothetical protein
VLDASGVRTPDGFLSDMTTICRVLELFTKDPCESDQHLEALSKMLQIPTGNNFALGRFHQCLKISGAKHCAIAIRPHERKTLQIKVLEKWKSRWFEEAIPDVTSVSK